MTSFGSSKSEETTIISRGVKIEGKITSSGNIRIDGEIQGDIFCESNITIGEDAKVNGQINANVITIGGKVSGIVRAKDKLILDSKSNLKGDIFTKNLVIEEGAKFDGKCKTGDSIDIGESQETNRPSTTITK
ncbi:MAG: polymer-forming cytoskeletal protein [Candidatus Heimdallarchaeota archaeon]|nr:polymer-forming cytoskeletal protein [Candidatus Heimdallarchaeota archaeon]